jgi:catechol 2,3-dioxygenase-like lactoylglutathione lyase family enzyme
MNLRLQHIAIARPPGSDAAARAFYGDVLGLPEIPSPANLATLDLIWYQLAADTELHIMVEEPMGQDHSGRHFCLAVDDLMEARARLEAAGISAVSDLPIPGRPRFFIRDPFGNLIEITSIEDDYAR